MKYSDQHDIISQSKPIAPQVSNAKPVLQSLKTGVASLFKPRFDPTRLTKAERREAGIMDCEVEWYKAWYGPLVK